MHFPALVLGIAATIIAPVIAQLPSGIPSCAQTCIGSSFGGCQTLDVRCICSNQQYISQLSCCISQKCTQAEQQAAVAFANNFCGTYGVTVPQSASCSSSSASSTPAPSSTAGSSAVATSIGGVHNATMTGSGMSSMSGTATMSGGSGGSSSSASGSSAAAQSSAAAGRLDGGWSGVMGLFLGAVALL